MIHHAQFKVRYVDTLGGVAWDYFVQVGYGEVFILCTSSCKDSVSHGVIQLCYIYFGTWACLGFQQIPPRSWDLLPLTWDGWETTAEQNCRSLQRSFRKNTTGNCMVYKKVGKGDSFWKLSLSGSILFHVASIWLGVVPYQFLCKVGSANSTIRKPVASSGGIRKTRKC